MNSFLPPDYEVIKKDFSTGHSISNPPPITSSTQQHPRFEVQLLPVPLHPDLGTPVDNHSDNICGRRKKQQPLLALHDRNGDSIPGYGCNVHGQGQAADFQQEKWFFLA
jgi:hypothetical protein